MSLKDYIQGKRHGKEANQLEREAMNDPFLQDAIEGFDSVQGNHLDIIEQLEHKIEKKRSQKNFYIRYAVLSTAAMLALVLGISVLFPPSEVQTPLAQKIITQTDSDSVAATTITNITSNQLKQSKENNTKKNNISTPFDSTSELQNQVEFQEKDMRNEFVKTAPVAVYKKSVTGSVTKVSHLNGLAIVETNDSPNISYGKTKNENSQSIYGKSEINKNSISTKTAVNQTIENLTVNSSDSDNITSTRIKQSNVFNSGSSSRTLQSTNTIKGKVIDDNGEPIIGASVYLKNNKYIGTITDIEGNFTLQNPNEKTGVLEVRYIGYKNKTVAADSSVVVQMEEDNLALNEVVTVGYGHRKIFRPKTSPTISKELSGKMAGIDVKTTDKKPVFGISEFRKYVKSQLSDTLCNNAHYKLTATFFIDGTGKPTGTKIVYSNCRSLETEFLRLTNESPQWTNINKKVKVTIKK